MVVDRGRNCYAYGKFGHMARHYRNQGGRGRMEERRMELERERFKDNMEQIEHLKEEKNLEALN